MLSTYTLCFLVDESLFLWTEFFLTYELHTPCENKAGVGQVKVLTSLHLLAVLGHVIWADGAEELDVVVTVVFGHLFSVGFVGPLTRKHTRTFHFSNH